MHQQAEAERQRALAAAQQGTIPAGGGMVAVNMSSPDPKTGKNRRIYLPSESIEWLLKKLADQGKQVEETEDLPDSAKVGIAEQAKQQPQGQEQGSVTQTVRPDMS